MGRSKSQNYILTVKYILTVRPEAEQDMLAIFSHYEDIRVGLGYDFILCAEQAISRVETNPLQYRVVHKKLRKVAVQRFPYRVFYLVQENNIIVTAVFHVRKSPEEWDTRIQ